MHLFVGLGNPGQDYARNRHNIGFMAVEAIAAAHGFAGFREKNKGLYAEGRLGAQKVLLLKPVTYMNLSGESVQPFAAFYKIPPGNITVFHDELDIPAGKIKMKKGGGNAGHNGLKSISQHLGTDDYRRVRMGIAHPGDRARVTGHVLGNFTDDEQAWLDRLLKAIAAHAPDLVKDNPNDFTARVTQDLKDIIKDGI